MSDQKVTDTILFHFVRSLVTQWEKERSSMSSRNELAVFICNALAETVLRIEESDRS
jgi:hypothetical protein